MSIQPSERNTAGLLDTDSLLLEWTEAPWDTAVLGAPVLQIDRLEVRGPAAAEAMRTFELARDGLGSRLVSCRLFHGKLQESMLLEDRGFRFIEMLFQPEFDRLDSLPAWGESSLRVTPASKQVLPNLMAIAGTAFHDGRFHVDPRLDSRLGDQRYRNWVANCLGHPSLRLYSIHDGEALVAFFVTELLSDGTCYWHLNAIAPELQGKGYGLRVWMAMLHHARHNGAHRVRTSISARNHRVLNLYARLGFRFPAPLMTFHWVSPE